MRMFKIAIQIKKNLKNYFIYPYIDNFFPFTSFVSLFIPVLRDAKTKRSRAFDARLCFTPTCPDDGTSILDCTSPGSFFPVKNNNLLFLGKKAGQV